MPRAVARKLWRREAAVAQDIEHLIGAGQRHPEQPAEAHLVATAELEAVARLLDHEPSTSQLRRSRTARHGVRSLSSLCGPDGDVRRLRLGSRAGGGPTPVSRVTDFGLTSQACLSRRRPGTFRVT
jgi:hypothetical protein